MADQRAAFKPAAVLVTGLGLTAALLSTGLSGPAAASTSAEARKMVAFEQRLQPSSRSPRVPTPAPVLDLYRVVDRMLDDDPSYWGGAYVDRRRLAVLATEAPVAARQRARQEYGLDSRLLRFQSTKHSLAQLDHATSKTLSEVTAANKTATVGPQFGAESQITVGIKADDPQLRSDLAEVAAETSVPVTVYQTRPAAPKSRLRYNKVAAGAEYIPYNDQGEGGWCSTAVRAAKRTARSACPRYGHAEATAVGSGLCSASSFAWRSFASSPSARATNRLVMPAEADKITKRTSGFDKTTSALRLMASKSATLVPPNLATTVAEGALRLCWGAA